MIQLPPGCMNAHLELNTVSSQNSPAVSVLFPQVFLIFGKSGWIGGLVGQYLKEQGAKFEYASCRLEDRAAVISEIERVRCWCPQASGAQPLGSKSVLLHKPTKHGAVAVPAGQANPRAERCWPHWQAQR